MLGGLLGVAGRDGLLLVGLEVGAGLLELGDHVGGAGAAPRGWTARHWSSSTPRIACSTLRMRPSRSFIRSRGTLPAASQRSAMSRNASLAALQVGDRDAAPRPRRAGPPSSPRWPRTPRRARRWPRRGRRRTCPGRRGTASRAGRRRPWGPGRRPSTGASGRGTCPAVGPHSVESASASASTTSFSLTTRALVALLVEVGEVRLAAPGVRRPGGREPAPQRVVDRLLEPGERLPLVEQLAHPVGAVAPVVALATSFSASAAIRSLSPRASSSLRARSSRRCSRCASIVLGQRVEPGVETGEVTDGLGVRAGWRAPA